MHGLGSPLWPQAFLPAPVHSSSVQSPREVGTPRDTAPSPGGSSSRRTGPRGRLPCQAGGSRPGPEKAFVRHKLQASVCSAVKWGGAPHAEASASTGALRALVWPAQPPGWQRVNEGVMDRPWPLGRSLLPTLHSGFNRGTQAAQSGCPRTREAPAFRAGWPGLSSHSCWDWEEPFLPGAWGGGA